LVIPGPSATSPYQVQVARTDTYKGFSAADLVAVLGTTGEGSVPPVTVPTPGLVVVRGSGASPGAIATIAQSPLAILAADGRYEVGLAPSNGLQIAPASSLATVGIWVVKVSPDASGVTFTLTAAWSNGATVDTTASLAAQSGVLSGALGPLVSATPEPMSGTTAPTWPPQAGTYPLQPNLSDNKAFVNIPSRS
jgi:hypothetical protein